MANKSEINCPHYEGDGYTYSLEDTEFNICEDCNLELFHKMANQYKLEKECDKEFKDMLKRHSLNTSSTQKTSKENINIDRKSVV